MLFWHSDYPIIKQTKLNISLRQNCYLILSYSTLLPKDGKVLF